MPLCEADAWIRRAQDRQNKLTKPPGSLGRLEEIANQLCAIQQTLEPVVRNPAIFVFAGDHGVCEEGVNAYPQSVTGQMVENFLRGGAAINAIARVADAELHVVDVGVIGSPSRNPKLLIRRVASSTRNICREPAMSAGEASAAMRVGMECAENAIRNGTTVLAIGEMGIGNTTIASALCAALTDSDPAAVCGKGTAADGAGIPCKVDAVRRALALHRPHIQTPLDLLARLGGLEIAAMCGVCMEAERSRCAVLIDGFISTAAAAIAVSMNPAVRDYLIAAHESTEPGHRVLFQSLRLRPLLQLQMRLGEGTGAALAIPIVRAAAETFRRMATFESAGVSESSA
ncbi:MAG TPA: nicotinate-nucleotide--dimethylbenzimidazole phosphoribosyltransferase [Bryobacteraceae bacterium]|jgi:nicotinate-nucleotide--dimethylbenzimidazole phosphoribosyltransferase|nr:nicotinate-nucleotide--dimethylbenzimidazole phosphoribosyltransferase [Bryobacteraceae bacterium]